VLEKPKCKVTNGNRRLRDGNRTSRVGGSIASVRPRLVRPDHAEKLGTESRRNIVGQRLIRKLVIFSPYGAPCTNGISDHVDQIVGALADQDLPAIDRIGVTSSAHEVDISRGILKRGDYRGLNHLLDRFLTSACALVVHYVGYGYQQRGCPFWLIRG
jgi:hypothetical protein